MTAANYKKPAIYWLRRDFRLRDNPALREACKHEKLLIIYSLDSHLPYGEASKILLHKNIEVFQNTLKGFDQRLILFKGDFKIVLEDIAKEQGIGALYCNRVFEPEIISYDEKISKRCEDLGIYFESFNSQLIHAPDTVNKKDGTPYLVYSAFYKNAVTKERFQTIAMPRSLKPGCKLKFFQESSLKDFNLIPHIDWHKNFDLESCGEQAAEKALNSFIKKKIRTYNKDRDIPSIDGTSRLSHFFSFGNLTTARASAAVLKADPKLSSQDSLQYHKELYWREFSYHLLINHPKTLKSSLNEKFNRFPWKKSRKNFEAWKRGLTGYPIVDAGMRELWQTGHMHNRVRMIVASFLIKDLFIHWKDGERYFWETLLDADLASNVMGWQWVSGGGADAAPFFRIFNPVTQSQKFDPEGTYIKTYVPELSKLGKKFIHAPFEAGDAVLKEAGITLGVTYPASIVDHSEARMEALMNYDRYVKK